MKKVMRKKLSRGDKLAKFREFTFANRRFFFIFRKNKLSRFSCNRKIKCSDTVFLTEKKYQTRRKMGINFRELKTTIFRENNFRKFSKIEYFAASNFREFARIRENRESFFRITFFL